MLQATFGASALAGPAVGGLMYGLLRDSVTPWAAPQFVGTLLYIVSFICAYIWLDETADVDTNKSGSVKTQQDPPALLQHLGFKYMLIMVAAHSYFFTGWEVGYPLFAQDTHIGQGWTTREIGFNFLVGSMGLMLYSLCGYAIVERHLGLERIWRWSWLLVLGLLPIFPRAVATVASSPGAVQLVNYFVQICISVLIGSQFLTLQLIMNKYIAQRPDAGVALSIANGWMVSAQAVARAVSPIFTGSLFTLSHNPNIGDRGLVFDSLAAVGLVLCVFVGILYESVAHYTWTLICPTSDTDDSKPEARQKILDACT
jgi:hypothetical protein